MGYLKKAFGENIKLARKSRKMTQEQLAEKVNIDLRQLARLESGESFATAETIEKLCESLNVSTKVLFDIDNENEMHETFETINNYKILNQKIKKLAHNTKKTEFICLAIEAMESKAALEKLKGSILGLELK